MLLIKILIFKNNNSNCYSVKPEFESWGILYDFHSNLRLRPIVVPISCLINSHLIYRVNDVFSMTGCCTVAISMWASSQYTCTSCSFTTLFPDNYSVAQLKVSLLVRSAFQYVVCTGQLMADVQVWKYSWYYINAYVYDPSSVILE